MHSETHCIAMGVCETDPTGLETWCFQYWSEWISNSSGILGLLYSILCHKSFLLINFISCRHFNVLTFIHGKQSWHVVQRKTPSCCKAKPNNIHQVEVGFIGIQHAPWLAVDAWRKFKQRRPYWIMRLFLKFRKGVKLCWNMWRCLNDGYCYVVWKVSKWLDTNALLYHCINVLWHHQCRYRCLKTSKIGIWFLFFRYFVICTMANIILHYQGMSHTTVISAWLWHIFTGVL